MGRYTRGLSQAITRYIPIIAFLSSIYGTAYICDSIALLVVALPYTLLALAVFGEGRPRRVKLALILLYVEVSLLILVKYGLVNRG